jgi:hypothetical protein
MNDMETLPRLIDQAMAALDHATTAAEVLDARDRAKVAYDAAKSAARFAKAKSAHATILATCHRMQADALTIEARAQSRLADEYDAAQERGEVQQHGGQGKRDIPDKNIPPVTDIGLTSKQVHQARKIRDAEKREPGIVRHTLDAKLEAGEEPTRADVKRAVDAEYEAFLNTADPSSDEPTEKAKEDAHHDRIKRYQAWQDRDLAVDAVKGSNRNPIDQNEQIESAQDEIAPPEVIAENILYCIARVNENARVFNKLFKLSTFDRETAARINTEIDGMIKKWRSIQSTLERGN